VIPGSKKIVWDVSAICRNWSPMNWLCRSPRIRRASAGTHRRTRILAEKSPLSLESSTVYRTIGYTALGVGVASLAAGGYFLYRSNQAYDDFQNAADKDEEDDAKKGKNAEMIGLPSRVGFAAAPRPLLFYCWAGNRDIRSIKNTT
jgi:hypothetical protein